jgi:ArsR family transcriptional regulator
MERLFAGLADRTRLRLLNLMAGQEVCVCYFVEVLGLPQPTISRHLAYLRRIGLVEARRDGKWVHYRIAVPASPFARRVLADTLRWLSQDREMQRDDRALQHACCRPRRPARLSNAPLPSRTETLTP